MRAFIISGFGCPREEASSEVDLLSFALNSAPVFDHEVEVVHGLEEEGSLPELFLVHLRVKTEEALEVMSARCRLAGGWETKHSDRNSLRDYAEGDMPEVVRASLLHAETTPCPGLPCPP